MFPLIRYFWCTEYAQLPSIPVCYLLTLSLYSKEIPFTLHLQSSNPIHPPSPVLSTFGPQLTHVNWTLNSSGKEDPETSQLNCNLFLRAMWSNMGWNEPILPILFPCPFSKSNACGVFASQDPLGNWSTSQLHFYSHLVPAWCNYPPGLCRCDTLFMERAQDWTWF